MSKTARIGRRGGLTLLAAAAVVAGLILIVVAVAAQRSAPQPPRSVGKIDPTTSTSAGSSPSASPTTTTSGSAADAGSSASPSTSGAQDTSTPKPVKVLGASRPVRITIPAIGVDTKVNPIGLNKAGELAVPQPGPKLNQAAWFENSPTPGQPGPSIIEGHVDSVEGVSVFFKLGAVRPGNKIHVTRADGKTVTFTVNAIRDYKKASFPTEVVYGGDLGVPQLRLITCSDFDESIHHHVGNEVVFSHLTSTRG